MSHSAFRSLRMNVLIFKFIGDWSDVVYIYKLHNPLFSLQIGNIGSISDKLEN
jgi:hypothetical protein